MTAYVDIRKVWKRDGGALAEDVLAGAGFSFLYDGIAAGPNFSADWVVESHDLTADDTQVVLKHASGLQVTRQSRTLREFAAVEYKLCFKNTGVRTLPALSAVHALNIAFGEPALQGGCVVSSGGGLHDTLLPPSGFAIRTHDFQSTAHAQLSLELTTRGGRSSSKDLPWFFLQNDRLQEGLFVAFGWSGQWALHIALDRAARTLTLRGKIPDLNIVLEAGEEIEGATILVGAYKGSVNDGANRLRRLIRAAYTPRLAGAAFMPAATYSNWYDLWGEFDEPQLKKSIDAAAVLGQEYFVLDAGWYAGASEAEGGFSSGLGNWDEIDRRKLPNGLEPIADYVRSKGLEFGLWFEPERVIEGSRLARAHSDWILWERERETASWASEIMPAHPFFKQRFGILNFGRADVQDWACSMMDGYIKRFGVKYVRHDFNIDPLPYWDANDAPHRRGITQIRYLQGLYRVMDWLREQNPHTVFEGCASGGLRMDLEMARRNHVFWISDNHADTAISRFHLHGINYFLPGNYNFVTYIRPLGHDRSPQTATEAALQPGFEDFDFQSLFGGAFGMGGRVDLWPHEARERAVRHVQVWKSLRRYLIEDYYPLTPQPRDLHSWSGWQFHDPDDQSGFFQVFRTETPDAARHFPVHQLEAGAVYRFEDPYSGRSIEVTGTAAMSEGIEMTQRPMSSGILMYKKVGS